MLIADDFTLEKLHALTIKGELLLLGIGIASVVIGEWVVNSPEAGLGKVVVAILFLLLCVAFYCYIESLKVSPDGITKGSTGLKIVHTLSLFAAISICSFICMLFCWSTTNKVKVKGAQDDR